MRLPFEGLFESRWMTMLFWMSVFYLIRLVWGKRNDDEPK